MGSRCHYPFSDRGGVRAHLLAIHTSRTARNPRPSNGRAVKVLPDRNLNAQPTDSLVEPATQNLGNSDPRRYRA
jgi:hypothetical protein